MARSPDHDASPRARVAHLDGIFRDGEAHALAFPAHLTPDELVVIQVHFAALQPWDDVNDALDRRGGSATERMLDHAWADGFDLDCLRAAFITHACRPRGCRGP